MELVPSSGASFNVSPPETGRSISASGLEMNFSMFLEECQFGTSPFPPLHPNALTKFEKEEIQIWLSGNFWNRSPNVHREGRSDLLMQKEKNWEDAQY